MENYKCETQKRNLDSEVSHDMERRKCTKKISLSVVGKLKKKVIGGRGNSLKHLGLYRAYYM